MARTNTLNNGAANVGYEAQLWQMADALRNRALHRLLVDGVTVEYRDAVGNIRGAQARVIDFDNPASNDWLAVNQFSVVENKLHQRLRHPACRAGRRDGADLLREPPRETCSRRVGAPKDRPGVRRGDRG